MKASLHDVAGSHCDVPPSHDDLVVLDLRFASLLGSTAWAGLPPAIQRRFSKRLASNAALTYAGEVVACRRTAVGQLLSQLCRLIGAPLPLSDDVAVPAVVTVTEDSATGGQFWMRMYGRTDGFPQVIHSSKRFAGPTGLEEYLGSGFGIALTISANTNALHFHSDHYFVAVGARRMRLPRWLGPGSLTISHIDRGEAAFAFVLSLRHPLFGELIHQTCVFHEHSAQPSQARLP